MQHRGGNYYGDRGGRKPFSGNFNRANRNTNQFRDKTKRAPLQHCNEGLMNQINSSETLRKKRDRDPNWMNHVITRNQSDHNKQKQILNDEKNSLDISSNIYPLEFHKNLVITEWDILDNRNAPLLNTKLWKQLYKNKQNLELFRRKFVSNYSDYKTHCLFTASTTDHHGDRPLTLDINHNEYRLKPRKTYGIKEFSRILGHDEASKDTKATSVSDQRSCITPKQYQIYRRLIDVKFGAQHHHKKFENVFYVKRRDQIDDLWYLEGFKANIVHILKPPYLGIKIWSRFLFMEKRSLRDHLKQRCDHSKITNRQCFVSYSMSIITIKGVDDRKNEKDGFDQKGKMVSFEEYMIDHYKMDPHRIQPERYGLVKDAKDNMYLPQFLHLIVSNTDQRSIRAHKKLYKMKQQRIRARVSFIETLESDEKDKDKVFTINKNAVDTTGYLLRDPKIEFVVCGGFNDPRAERKVLDMAHGLKQWKNLAGTIDSQTRKESKPWTIHIYGKKTSVDKLSFNIEKYVKKRNFYDFFDWKDIKLKYISEWKQIIRDLRFDNVQDKAMVICILEGGHNGSEQKRALHSIFMEKGITSQFIEESNVFAAIKVYGMMDDVMFKVGESLYGLVCDKSYHNSLLLGMDVNHCTNKSTIRPSIGVMCGIRKYYVPQKRRINGCAALLNHRQEIPSKPLAKIMCKKVLFEQLKKLKELPHVIWYFRDGVSESMLEQLQSTEVAGVLEAISEVKTDKGLVKYFEEKALNEWTPKLEIVVVQKRINDEFFSKKRLDTNQNCYVVPLDVVHNVMLDLYIQKGDHHPLRVIFLRDDLEFSRNGKIMECCQFMLDLLYAFPYGMPLGACSIPSPIKWSDKWAQTYQELIHPDHRTIEEISKFLNLAYIQPKDTSSSNTNTHQLKKEDEKKLKKEDEHRERKRERERSREKEKERERSRSRSRGRKEEREMDDKKSRSTSRGRWMTEQDRERDRDRYGDRHRQTDRSREPDMDRDRNRGRDWDKDWDRDRDRDRDRNRDRDRYRYRDSDNDKERDRSRERDRERNRYSKERRSRSRSRGRR